jgi:exosortase K
MKTNKNIPYYLTAIGIFILLKVVFTFANNDDLIFLLKPTDKLVGWSIGSQSVYLADEGFFHEKINIVIEKSCSGFNFWILSFLVFAYLGLKYADKYLYKILTIPAALFCAYLLTIFANASRIVASIVVRNQTVGIFPDKQPLIHEIVGITTYFSFLVLTYYLIEKFLKYKKQNAKLA